MIKINNLHIPIILISVCIALISNFGSLIFVIKPLTYTDFNVSNLGYVSMFSFEQTYYENSHWWRLITPMFIHFSFAHLAFNCLWIYILGEKIEKIDGSFVFFCLVIFSAIFSNSLQFFWSNSSLFGGLSGVIYALIGFCMVNEMDSPYGRYDIPPGLYLFMIIWLVLGFLGIVEMFGFGAVANFAHLGGLISGIIFAEVYKFFPLNRSNYK